MAHFALTDKNKVVLQVIVVDDKDCPTEEAGIAYLQKLYEGQKGSIFSDPENSWVQTSYNESIRKNYAAIGYEFDEAKNAFVAPQPEGKAYDVNLNEKQGQYVLNKTTCKWEFIPS